ncbi:CDGSH iron-sulfur domain-containing protein [Nonomuraea typhae]|uniref:CDGSH iron-sulfur domain-containing protein n=1 Tax=Nonomuraea typhae TaxID=2603600 RepID=UPI0012F7DFAA
MHIQVTEDGPYEVTGSVPLAKQSIGADGQGQSVRWEQGAEYPAKETYRLCRCGRSGSKPYCDGSHERVGFDGTEVASREPYLMQAGEQDGPEVTLTDAPALCAFARFCDADGQVWSLVEMDGQGSAVRQEAGNCPSGRLVAWDLAARTPLEPDLPPSIGLVEDPVQGVSGPIWVRGGIAVTAADGTDYEVRNRVTLCRCGASRNKPFCDGSHAAIGFRDE